MAHHHGNPFLSSVVYGWAVLKIEVEPEIDGRWIGEVPALPGVMAYGATKREARSKVAALALRVIADLVAHGELLLQEAGEPFALWPTNK